MDGLRFGDWIRGNRRRLKLSQERLSVLLDMDRGHISRIENGVIKLPEEETRERFHRVFGTTEQDLIDLGIVPQFDEWGRPVRRDPVSPAPVIANPFTSTDPRHKLAQLLLALDLNGPHRAESLQAIDNLTNVLSSVIAHQKDAADIPSTIDIKAKS